MSTDAAGGVEDSAVRGNAEPPQDGVQVAGLLLARGPRVLVNGKEHLGMAEEQVFGPVGCGHWLAMRLALFGGVAVPHGGSFGFRNGCTIPSGSCSRIRVVSLST